MSALGQKTTSDSGLGRRQMKTRARSSAAPKALNGHSPAIDSLRPAEGVSYDILSSLAGFWLRRLQIKVLKSYEKHIADLQLRPVEAAALILLLNNRDLTQNALAGALGTDQSTMVGISTRLEERGFIERRRQSNDRRYQILNLTKAGRKTTTTIKRRLRAHNENVLRNLSSPERASFFALLAKLVD
jgi:DNA-binding MarR family transcriptional regulator